MELAFDQILSLAPFVFSILIMLAVFIARKFNKDITPKTAAFILSAFLVVIGTALGLISVDNFVATIVSISTSAIGTYEVFKKYLND